MLLHELRITFQKMDDARLLATLAFFETEYTADALLVRQDVARSRGFSESVVKSHRESCFPDIDLKFTCWKCGTELLADRDTFVEGAGICPDCRSDNPINYLELEPASSPPEPILKSLLMGGLVGAIWTASSDVKKGALRREAILDGTYWRALREMKSSS